MPVTEVASMPLAAGANILDRGSQAARVWEDMTNTISRQDGCQSLYYGLQHENPNTAQLFIVWDTIESHELFQTLPSYQQMLKSLEGIMAGPPQLFHFELKSPSDLDTALSAPVTELATIFLSERTSSFYSNLESFAKVLNENAEGISGISYSWIIEDIEHESFGAGVKGKACLLSVGWSSISAHEAFTQTDAFGRGLEFLEEARGSEIHHTSFQAAV